MQLVRVRISSVDYFSPSLITNDVTVVDHNAKDKVSEMAFCNVTLIPLAVDHDQQFGESGNCKVILYKAIATDIMLAAHAQHLIKA